MLIPRTHAWTRLQKRLILAAVVVALIGVGVLVYAYERHYRGPSESAFFGIWERASSDSDSPLYFEFRPDQTFRFASSPTMRDEEETASPAGKWYAGGPNLYLRFDDEFFDGMRPSVFQIVDIQTEEFRVRFIPRYGQYAQIWTFRRVHPNSPRASNQAMERTPDRS